MLAPTTIDDVTEYDPQAWGADCPRCPLRGGKVVPPELRRGAVQLHVAEAPGKTEEELRRPLVGPSGSEHGKALVECGWTRSALSITNAILCKPHGGNLKRYLATLRQRNKARKEHGQPPIPSPVECCWGRLRREVALHSSLLLMGAASRQIVYAHDQSGGAERGGGEKKLMRQRGFPDEIEIDGRWLSALSTVHPAFVLRTRRWTEVFRADVAKARRMALRRLQTVEPPMVFAPSPARLGAILSALERDLAERQVPIAYDVETDGLESTEANLRCIGIGSTRLVTCVPFRSVEEGLWQRGIHAYYTPAEWLQVRALLEEFFARAGASVVDQNGQYDLEVIERHGFELRRARYDTAIGHHVIHSEWPHDLAFQAAQYTDQLSWKEVDHAHWEHDVELWRYCMLDVVNEARACECQLTDERLRGQLDAFRADMRLSAFCKGLHKVGMKVDRTVQQIEGAKLEERMKVAVSRARGLAVSALGPKASAAARRFASTMNIGSPPQLRRYLFDACGVEPVPEKAGGLTETGEIAVDRDALLFLIDRGLPPELEEFIHAVVDYREAQKLRSSYCTSATMVPRLDGRVRPSWNPHVVVSGRLSTSKPNVMNIKGSMRGIFVCEPGHLLVACDKAQLELRIIAQLARDEGLIRAFLSGADVHRVNACTILGIASPEEVTKNQRRFTKTFTYASQYGAGVKKTHQMIKNYREPDGSRPYKKYRYREADVSAARWWRAHWPVKQYHDEGLRLWREQGYLASAITGRRRYFLDGTGDEAAEEAMKNFRIQATAADDVNFAIDRVLERYPFGFAGPYTGPVHYNYDSLMLEVPAAMALEVGRDVRQIMYSELEGMPLPCDLGIGPSWGDLEDPDEPEKCTGEWWARVRGARELGLAAAL